jgi:hypothetical protein
MRIANAVMLVLFASWAGFQHNDPDVLVWVALYGAAAVECALFFLGRVPRLLSLAYVVLCVTWGLYLGVRVLVAREFIFEEQGREMMGLLICGGWTYVLYRSARRLGPPEAARHV